MLTGTLCFGADACLVLGKHNFLGSWNDSATSADFQATFIDPFWTLPEAKVASDSAFPVSGLLFCKIITPLKTGDLDRVPLRARAGVLPVSAACSSVRQVAEWGMGAVEKVWRILLLLLPFNPNQRRIRLNNVYRLYNLRVRTFRVWQIGKVFQQDDH